MEEIKIRRDKVFQNYLIIGFLAMMIYVSIVLNGEALPLSMALALAPLMTITVFFAAIVTTILHMMVGMLFVYLKEKEVKE